MPDHAVVPLPSSGIAHAPIIQPSAAPMRIARDDVREDNLYTTAPIPAPTAVEATSEAIEIAGWAESTMRRPATRPIAPRPPAPTARRIRSDDTVARTVPTADAANARSTGSHPQATRRAMIPPSLVDAMVSRLPERRTPPTNPSRPHTSARYRTKFARSWLKRRFAPIHKPPLASTATTTVSRVLNSLVRKSLIRVSRP